MVGAEVERKRHRRRQAQVEQADADQFRPRVSMGTRLWQAEKCKPNEEQSYTAELEKLQTKKYASLFKTLRKYKKNITGVTFWNVSDKYTWLDEYPVKGRKNYPLLFDTNNQPKKAFWEVVKF